ncbi:hypothetical protein J4206_04405 [Candidatus Woesearchaeota archaeon]|nr:hypothetical protein [Candidatus Woesearchaeota archaeon]
MNKGKTTLLIAILGCLLAVSLGLIGLIVSDLSSYESVSDDVQSADNSFNGNSANIQPVSFDVEQESTKQNQDEVQETVKQEDKVDSAYLAKVELLDEPVREAVKKHVSKTKRKVDLSAPVVTSEVAKQVVNKSKDVRVIVTLKEPEFKDDVISSLMLEEFELRVESDKWFAGMINNESLGKLQGNILINQLTIDRLMKTAAVLDTESFPQVNADKVTNLQVLGVTVNGTNQNICHIDSGVDYEHTEFPGA